MTFYRRSEIRFSYFLYMKNIDIAKHIVNTMPIKYLKSGSGAPANAHREYSMIPANGFMYRMNLKFSGIMVSG